MFPMGGGGAGLFWPLTSPKLQSGERNPEHWWRSPPADDRWESHAEWQESSEHSIGEPGPISEDSQGSDTPGHCRATPHPPMASGPTRSDQDKDVQV